MNYHRYYPVDVVNGEGTRCTLFVAGCVHQCRGCYNKSTWSLDSGLPFTQSIEDQIIKDLQDTEIKRQGLSLSGGDPLHPQNVPTILKLVKRVKTECDNKDIWLWTGYKLDELTPEQQAVIPYIDVLIDGKFVQEQADPKLLWRGSSNQIIYRFK
ncbi:MULTISPECIES: anaerobic ribonucleoside-triphosphate reductase-activating protein [unclassified Gilliamella]|uniref:anaerobic ribonucleoside-triphosphate reductase-activating protein n=1 Tax=unclassified Gilliamella TaxID=2685620 RepID=UPI00226ADC03|nr:MULTISPECIES: anaerobic ribonucleoside-triphosphate reductase-activating protein [unclassified Gilliamella]MCX8574151.1 anaerobic ribonucleoside-triphosphate reductase-activating protein [Gilliamella sp. B3831]MCX8576382.1 anaerobic ribonucleoside-triphosphate reductase-activating protein [Gilliamella sp. B3815]MCX8577823.1 anaerobic ribonucleoside-triphosphate reductase-activating protein [Gilliamella sp. B2717]MCX8587695.1 anaerobic ribonucleoside-triphosphate reductase-activating protein 